MSTNINPTPPGTFTENSVSSRLSSDLQEVAKSTGTLLRDARSATTEGLNNASLQAREKLRATGSRLEEQRQIAAEHARTAIQTTRQYVSENPWKAIAIGSGIGFIVGLLLHRE